MLKRSRDIYLLAEAAVMAHDVIVEVAAITKLENQIELRLRIYHLVKSDHVRMLHQLHASHLRTLKQKRMMIGHGGMQRGQDGSTFALVRMVNDPFSPSLHRGHYLVDLNKIYKFEADRRYFLRDLSSGSYAISR